ncbi:MAG: hypothetical protein DRQ48_05760 [Gammaproteobacteria bacterium]|nr:MAG: hypothetical protein DRQ48_05760 [Gammaproteobacteria bacterium]
MHTNSNRYCRNRWYDAAKYLCCALALSFAATDAKAADEVITITGTGPKWCDGFGHETIFNPGDAPNDCACGDGWEQIEEPDDSGEPECGLIIDTGGAGDGDDGGLDEPPPGGGGGNDADPPSKPTLAQCETMKAQCLKNATALAGECRANRTKFFQNELANGRPCHSQSLGDLLDGFQYRVLWMYYDCRPEDFFDISSTYTDNCRKQAIARGSDRCFWGIDARSAGQGNSATFSGKLKSPVFEIGGSATQTTTLTVSAPFGMGTNQACMAMGVAATDQCSADFNACRALASDGETGTATRLIVTPETTTTTATGTTTVASGTGTASVSGTLSNAPASAAEMSTALDPAEEMAPRSLAELLAERIDRVLLGLDDDTSALGSRMFRPIPRQRLEIEPLHIERLRFLADWSGFLNRNDISQAKRDAMHGMLRKAQEAVQSQLETEGNILAAVWAVDMRSGTFGSDAARAAEELFHRQGGLSHTMVQAQGRVNAGAKRLLGDALGFLFLDEVWPGSLVFGFASPFEARQQALPLSDPAPVDPGPVNQ